jgi:glycerophosphoryl diester phosphodiesterase
VLLLAEYGEGSHNEWGAGHYSPLFGSANPSGYLRKEIIVTTKPSAITSKPNVKFDLRPSGKGSISISAPADIAKVNYLILNPEQYNQALELLNNTESYLQWFTTSTLAKELFGAVEAKGNIQIDASKLNLKPDTDYRLLVTASGNSYGTKQSFAVHTFNLPPSAPLPAGNIIIAHRGGSAEAGKAATPDNSIASLNYAMRLGCYASETDIYWTKDNKIVVAHANSDCKINGLYPWEHTLAEIQAAGRLTNGEIVPSLEDYIRAVMVKGSKTKICLDIKSITKPTTHHPESVKACQRACEIIAEMEAQNFCEFICSGYEDIVKHCAKYANAIGVDIGAMGKFTASQYKGWGYTWHNRDKGYDISQSKLKSYIDAGMEVSVFTIDTDADWALISGHWKQLRGITTNYPKRMLEKTK